MKKTLAFISYALSALFSGLALTVMTIKSEENDYE